MVNAYVNDWRAAEENAAAWMRTAGYADASVTRGGADGGIDVTATGVVAQVKFEAHQVGRPHLQRFVGATVHLNDTDRLFFTGAGYTETAQAYADQAAIALFTYGLDGTVRPINAQAVGIAASSSALHARTTRGTPDEDLAPQASGGSGEASKEPETWGHVAVGVGMVLVALAIALVLTFFFFGGLLNPANWEPVTTGAVLTGTLLFSLMVGAWVFFAAGVSVTLDSVKKIRGAGKTPLTLDPDPGQAVLGERAEEPREDDAS